MYGYVLANLAGNVVNFALALNTTGSSTTADFVYLSNKVNTVKLVKSITLNLQGSHVLTTEIVMP